MAKKLSDTAQEILELLKENGGEMTFREIKDIIPKANPSHLGSIIRNGYGTSRKGVVEEVIRRKSEKTIYRAKAETESDE